MLAPYPRMKYEATHISMDSATSSIELIFRSCFELFNRKFANLQQKKRFYAQFFYGSHKRCFLALLPPLLSYSRRKLATFSTIYTNRWFGGLPCQSLLLPKQAVYQNKPISCITRCSEMICHLHEIGQELD